MLSRMTVEQKEIGGSAIIAKLPDCCGRSEPDRRWISVNIVLDRCRFGKEKAADLAALKLVRNKVGEHVCEVMLFDSDQMAVSAASAVQTFWILLPPSASGRLGSTCQIPTSVSLI